MIGYLYRYPHPFKAGTWLYTGQESRQCRGVRDAEHRRGYKGFGRRFRILFPNIKLPLPVREQFEVSNQSALNEEEIIWMFRFHTWHGYPDGMNLTLPGNLDYHAIGRIGGRKGGLKGGPIQGRKNVLSGQLAAVRNPAAGGRIGGRKNVESGQLSQARTSLTPCILSDAGRKANHNRWHTRQGRTSSTCKFCTRGSQ